MTNSHDLSEEEEEEVQALAALFSEIDLLTVRQIYISVDRDYREAQARLAELARDPSALHTLLAGRQLPVSTGAQDGRPDAAPGRAQAERLKSSPFGSENEPSTGGLAALAMAPGPQDDLESPPMGLPEMPAFDMNTLTETLSQVGATVTDGITSLAANLTSWVADLASAFDATWGDDAEEQQRLAQQASAKDEPSVGFSSGAGAISDRPYQRRLGSSGSHPSSHPGVSTPVGADRGGWHAADRAWGQEEEDEDGPLEDEEDEENTKDD